MDSRSVLVVALAIAVASPGVAGASAAQDGASCSFPVSAVDATGTEVTVEQDPDEIVTLGPSAAQTLWEIGADEQVIGVSKFSGYLDGAAEKENVSGAGQQQVVAEQVVALEPDLVLAPNVIDNSTVDQLRDAGLTVFRFEEATSIEAVYEKTRLTGELVGECDGAEETAAWMEDRIDTVRDAVDGEDRPRVVYPLGGGYVVGTDTFVDEIITTAGGQNIAAAENLSGYPQISSEVIVERDPQWLVLNDGFEVEFLQDEAYDETTAVAEEQIVHINGDYANQPAPRIVFVITELAEAFHPEAYAEANTTAAETTTVARTATPAPDSDPGTTAPGETDGQPGFGVVGAVLALATILLAARSRL